MRVWMPVIVGAAFVSAGTAVAQDLDMIKARRELLKSMGKATKEPKIGRAHV